MQFVARSLIVALLLAGVVVAPRADAGEPAKPKVSEQQEPAAPPETLTEDELLRIENLQLRLEILRREIASAHHLGPADRIAPDGKTIIRAPKKTAK